MSQNTLRDSHSRYAIKQLRTDLIPPPSPYPPTTTKKRSRKAIHWRGMLDLAIEAEFLRVLSHPNIVKMRGVAACAALQPTCGGLRIGGGERHKMEGFYIVMDRLFGTLQECVEERWRMEEKALMGGGGGKRILGGVWRCMGIGVGEGSYEMRKVMQKEMYLERLTVAYDIASAFRFLHGKRLVYRDIKSANIGFDVRGDIKIFDFGLCKELPTTPVPSEGTRETGPLYKLTSRTGSRPYMAPEIMFGKPYNTKADVFSFGVLLYEIFALKLPFDGFDGMDYKMKVFSTTNYRPKLGKLWPTLMKSLLVECWDTQIENRPDFERIASVLKAEMADMADDLKSSRSGSVKNRTAHLLNRSAASRHNRMTSAASVAVADQRGGGATTNNYQMDNSQRSSHYRLELDDVE